MKINFSDLLYAFSYGLDCVENELIRVNVHHGSRVACFCALLGRTLGMEREELMELAGYAVLHDNALTQFIKKEQEAGRDCIAVLEGKGLGVHCAMGEDNIRNLPFSYPSDGAIRYHHEEADGSGPFGRKAEETPLYAQLIHMGDTLDVLFGLDTMSEGKYRQICSYVENNEHIRFSPECVAAFQQCVDMEALKGMNQIRIEELLRQELNLGEREYSNCEIHQICDFIAGIIDCKSHFTKSHSLGIAGKAERMGQYYGWDEDKCTLLYLAGAVHDLGKLAVPGNILEKPDKLTDEEFEQIQSHAYLTYRILSKVRGLEEITMWASLHHEKLNGRGYPFGKTGKELGFEERLLACMDIYQALTEPRPYKEGFSHEKTMEIMKGMADNGFIDSAVTEDIDRVFSIPSCRGRRLTVMEPGVKTEREDVSYRLPSPYVG